MKTIEGLRVPALAKWAVRCDPWEGEPYTVSQHSSANAALSAATKATRNFHYANGYGYRYYPAAKWGGGWHEVIFA